jgi:hypothetical protein
MVDTEPESTPPRVPRVPGPGSEKRIPPPRISKAAIPGVTTHRSGASVPVYSKLPERPQYRGKTIAEKTNPISLLFDALLALVSVAFCLLYYSEL